MSTIYIITAFVVVILSVAADVMQGRRMSKTLTGERVETPCPNRLVTILLASYLIFVGGFRYYVGVDYGFYYNTITATMSTITRYFGLFKEPGIRVISAVGRLFYDDGISTIFLSELVVVVLYVRTIHKYSPMFALSMCLYLFMGEWTGAFNGVRQYLASAVLFAGSRFIVEKKFIKYLITVFIASMFHVTAWVMLSLYFFMNRKANFLQLLLLGAAAIVISYSYDFLFDAIGYYKGVEMSMEQNAYYSNTVNILRVLVAIVPVVTFFAFCNRSNLSREENFYINGLFFNAFAMMGASGSAYLARIGIYSAPLSLIGYAYLFRLFKDKTLARIVMAVAFVLFIIYWTYTVKSNTFYWWFNRTE